MVKRLWLLFSQAVTISLAVFLAMRAADVRFGAEDMDPIEKIIAEDAQNPMSLSSAVDRAAPAVVTIFTRRVMPGKESAELGSDWNDFPELHLNALGSGVIVSPEGLVLTNFHVVEGLSSLRIALADGRTFEAELKGSDPETDLALLAARDARDLPVIEVGRSENLKVGDTVLAIGNPFDVGQSVTAGIVSALGRHGFGLNSYEDFIQTDAAINQGNSGGALVDRLGRLVGINSAIFSPEMSEGFVGIGFAIPTSIIGQVLPSLKEGRTVRRGYLGFVPQQLTEELARDLGLPASSGVMVKQVIHESPAFEAGLRPFDVVLSLDGERVHKVNRLLQKIAQIEPGRRVEVRVLRGEREIRFEVLAGVRPLRSLEKEPLPEFYEDAEEESTPPSS